MVSADHPVQKFSQIFVCAGPLTSTHLCIEKFVYVDFLLYLYAIIKKSNYYGGNEICFYGIGILSGDGKYRYTGIR